MKRLSIILPMYNVAPFVERCIRSLEDQDIPKEDYELICINDGSPDKCSEIVEQLQLEFSNIILINQENQGVSRARNNGIDKATGNYLLFIDPDDYVDTNSFARVIRTTEKSVTQVSFLGFSFLNEDGSLRRAVFNERDTGNIFPGPEAYYKARGDGQTDPDRMWGVLINRKFLIDNNLLFLANVPYLEDGELIARIMCLAERCIFDGHSFYQRTTRPGSATNSNLFRTEKATNGFILAAKNLKKFQSSNELSIAQKEFLNQPICKFILLTVNSCMSLKDFKKRKGTKRKLKNHDLLRCNLEGCDDSYSRYGRAYNNSFYLGLVALFVWPRINWLRRVWTKKIWS